MSPLTVGTILGWADAHHARHGRWPRKKDGPIDGVPGETWPSVESALRCGCRGLPAGDSLARLLQKHRGHRNRSRLPPLTAAQVRRWMLAYRERTGRWPTEKSGPVAGAPGETWMGLEQALRGGWRGLPGGSSLARLREGLAT